MIQYGLKFTVQKRSDFSSSRTLPSLTSKGVKKGCGVANPLSPEPSSEEELGTHQCVHRKSEI